MFNKKLLITGLILVILFVIIFLLVNFKVSNSFDLSVFKLINEKWSISFLDSFFAGVAIYGREYFWIPVVLLMWVLGSAFNNEKAKKGAVMLVIVFIAIIIIGLSLKAVYYRPRPFLNPLLSSIDHVLVPKDLDSSFPSGHALIVAGGAAVSFLFLRKRYSIPLVIEAALVSYSRVYVGVHYPTDVIAGVILGVAISFIICSILINNKYFNKLYQVVDTIYKKILKSVRLIK
ncbi:phosphatase PAP2 family protein [Candidatus Parvarchaeota archaeon]|nr:phosphatase PAP2 family protein [Candidatus Parvarchaeota archaeon]